MNNNDNAGRNDQIKKTDAREPLTPVRPGQPLRGGIPDEEATRCLTPDEQARLQQAAGKGAAGNAGKTAPKLDDTQSLPPLTDAAEQEESIQQPFPQQNDDVRQLQPALDRESGQGGWLTPRRKKAILLCAGFLIALFAGFAIAGYRQDQADLAANERQYQAQEMKDRQQKLDQQEKDLQQKRQQLEQQKKELEQQKRSLQQDSDRLAGRQEQMAADDASSSTVQKLLDKVTGKEADRQKAAQSAQQQQSQNTSSTDAVNQSLADAQSMLDDVNAKLSDVETMKNEAGKMKEKAANAYDENKDVIDTALYYVKAGASMALDMLLH